MNYAKSMQAVRAPGQIGFSAIGSLWMLAWCLQKHARDLSTLCLVLLAGTAILLWAWCDHRATHSALKLSGIGHFHLRSANPVLEGLLCGTVLLFNLVFALELLGHPAWLLPIFVVLTGLACLALGKTTQYRPHYLTGIALLSAAVVGPLAAGVSAHAVTCFAVGGILWISALHGLFAGHLAASRGAALAGHRSLTLSLH